MIFALFNVALGLTSRDETGTILRRDIVTDRRQLGLYGVAIAVIMLSTAAVDHAAHPRPGPADRRAVDALHRLCALVLLVVDEAIKFFLRRREHATPTQQVPAAAELAA